MFGIEVAFYFLGFATCLLLIAIIFRVNEKTKARKRDLRKRRYELEKEQETEIVSSREEINIDVKVY